MRASYLAIAAASTLLSSCMVGPDYKRPQVAVPANFRAPAPLPQTEAASLADLKWFEVFHDEALQSLIRVALEQNYDLRDAVTRVEQARANLGITRSSQLPQVDASGSLSVTRTSRDGATALPASIPIPQERNYGQAGLNLLSFELDLWGRLRRSTEAARANLLNVEENRKAVVSTLVSEVATNYLQLRELDYDLEISQRTLGNRGDFLRLTQQRQSGGIATLIDLRQSPGPVGRGRPVLAQALTPDVPAGLTSALVERRPDIRAAEQALIAANANIGVA
jgi:multidrug efflux system outer membrane protein